MFGATLPAGATKKICENHGFAHTIPQDCAKMNSERHRAFEREHA